MMSILKREKQDEKGMKCIERQQLCGGRKREWEKQENRKNKGAQRRKRTGRGCRQRPCVAVARNCSVMCHFSRLPGDHHP